MDPDKAIANPRERLGLAIHRSGVTLIEDVSQQVEEETVNSNAPSEAKPGHVSGLRYPAASLPAKGLSTAVDTNR